MQHVSSGSGPFSAGVRLHKTRAACLRARRKYREGQWEALEDALRLEKLRSGPGAVYCLGAKLDTPGVFYLGYIMSRTPHREYFTVTNTGCYFRHEVRAPTK